MLPIVLKGIFYFDIVINCINFFAFIFRCSQKKIKIEINAFETSETTSKNYRLLGRTPTPSQRKFKNSRRKPQPHASKSAMIHKPKKAQLNSNSKVSLGSRKSMS